MTTVWADSLRPPELVTSVRNVALLTAIVALGVAVLVATVGTRTRAFYFAYLTAFVFWTGVAVGCLALTMLQFVARGAWGVVIRRVAESGMSTLPVMALLFVPIALGLPHLFEWARMDPSTADEVLLLKRPYLNAPFFIARAITLFAIWVTFARLLWRWSSEEDRTGDPRFTQRARNLSGAGLVMYGLTVTLAATDWVMSLDARWSSSIFGILFMGEWGLSALSFVVLAIAVLSTRPPLQELLGPRHLHDLGTLLFAFVLLVAYFHFSQFVIIWSGNQPEEAPWYLRRTTGGWQPVALLLVMFHFVVPAAVLLSRTTKRRAWSLATVAGTLLAMRFLETWYLVAPEATAVAEHHRAVSALPGVLDLALYVMVATGVGGLWIAAFARALLQRPLLPPGDPLFSRALAQGHEVHG